MNRLVLIPKPASAAAARAFVRDLAIDAGFPLPAVDDIELAVGEAIANAVEHGRPAEDTVVPVIDLTVARERNQFIVEVTDAGVGLQQGNQHHPLPADKYATRGRGLGIIEVLMDEMSVRPGPGGVGVTVRMCRGLPAR